MTPFPLYRVLVVDDDPEARQTVELALRVRYEVLEAHDGVDALEKLDQYEPDFIILDGMMPVMDGFEACAAIRRRPGYAETKVLFLSAFDSRDNIARSYAAGGSLFLAKPFDPARLLRNVDLFFQENRPSVRPKRFTVAEIRAEEQRLRAAPPGRTAPPVATAFPAPPAPAASAPGPRPAAPGIPRVLIVDDDADQSRLVGMRLSNDFEVVYAHDGMDGIEKLVEYQPDLLLLDVMMPKMNGYQLCQSVRENRFFARMPILFLTAKASSRDREYALRMGGNGVLGKPYDLDEMHRLCMELTGQPGFTIRPKSKRVPVVQPLVDSVATDVWKTVRDVDAPGAR